MSRDCSIVTYLGGHRGCVHLFFKLGSESEADDADVREDRPLEVSILGGGVLREERDRGGRRVGENCCGIANVARGRCSKFRPCNQLELSLQNKYICVVEDSGN